MLAFALQSKGDLDGAIKVYRQAIEVQPRSARNHVALADLLRRKGRLKEALAELNKTVELAPDLLVYRARRADMHALLRQWEEALADYNWIIERQPNFPPLWCERAAVHLAMDHPGKALDDLSQCLKRAPRLARAWYVQASVHLHLKQFREARADYEKLLEVVPNEPLIFNDLAWLLAVCPDDKIRDPKRAVELARKAVALAPKEGTYHNTLGIACYRNGDMKEARVALEKSVQLRKGGDAFDWFFLAMTHARLGSRDEARKWYDQAVQWTDRNKKALANDPAHAEELRRFRSEADEILGIKKK